MSQKIEKESYQASHLHQQLLPANSQLCNTIVLMLHFLDTWHTVSTAFNVMLAKRLGLLK